MNLSKILKQHALWITDPSKGERANLPGENLSGANLSEANLSEANLFKANLSEANLFAADLSRANLSGADLSGANLYGANLYGANLSRSDLSGASLFVADLSGSDLSGANLSEVNLFAADLSGSDLSGTNLFAATLLDTSLDPNNTPNGNIEGFERDSEGYVIGYRTRDTPHIKEYLEGRIYAADYFSTCDTECHPGLYLWPNLRMAKNRNINYDRIIKVRTKPEDVHKAGNKWRCRWFEVLT